MSTYKFSYDNKEFELKEENCDYINNEEVEGLEVSNVIELLKNCEEVNFDVEYYDSACDQCRANRKDETKFFEYLEFHFYAFTKNNKFVLSSVSKEYENTTFTSLMKEKKIDNSFIVSVIACRNCGVWAIEVEQCEM